jgi:hypothetical protein
LSRKRTGPGTPGPMIYDDRVAGLVSQTKWDKTRASVVLELKEMVEVALAEEGGKSMPRQRLLEIRGYLNYIVRTYGWLNPYMKGLHNTIDGCRRDNRDEGGWKLTFHRGKEGLTALYCPGDTSGKGFGTALVMKKGVGILYESGMWTREYAEESSNFREAENLVIRLEKEVKEGDMRGREIFLFQTP